jgi:hypothetical protein
MPFAVLKQGHVGLGNSQALSHIALAPTPLFASDFEFLPGHVAPLSSIPLDVTTTILIH